MHKSQTVITLVVCALLVGACSRLPMPAAKNHAYSEQYIMQAAHHWDVLASHMAEKIYTRLNAEAANMQPVQPVTAAPQPAAPVAPMAPSAGQVAPLLPPPAAPAYQSQSFRPQSVSPALANVPPQNITPFHVYPGVNQNPYQPAPNYNTYAAYGAPGGGFQPVNASPGYTAPATPVAYSTPAPQMTSPGFSTAAALVGGMPPLFVPLPRETGTAFEKSFYHLLRSRLIQSGLTVVNRLEGPFSNCYSTTQACKALVVNYDVEVVNHKDRGGPMRYPGRTTAALLAGGAIAYILEEAQHNGERAWALAPLALGAEMYAIGKFYWPDETNTEVVISTSVTDEDLVVFSDTSIYYVNAGDQDHYGKTTKMYKVVN